MSDPDIDLLTYIPTGTGGQVNNIFIKVNFKVVKFRIREVDMSKILRKHF